MLRNVEESELEANLVILKKALKKMYANQQNINALLNANSLYKKNVIYLEASSSPFYTDLSYIFKSQINAKPNYTNNLADKNIREISSQEEDMKRIREFFLDKDKVVLQLKKLENQLKAYVVTPTYMTLFRTKPTDSQFKQHKMLSSFLYRWAKENGFATSVTITDSLSPKDFSAILAKRQLFKDAALGGSAHGEWTHFLQWWCVVEANKEKPFLIHTPAELLEWLGREENFEWLTTFEFNMSAPTTLYDKIFDKMKAHTLSDSVFGFNRYFFGEGQKTVPFLSELIVGRYNRREEKRFEQLKKQIGLSNPFR